MTERYVRKVGEELLFKSIKVAFDLTIKKITK